MKLSYTFDLEVPDDATAADVQVYMGSLYQTILAMRERGWKASLHRPKIEDKDHGERHQASVPGMAE